VPVRITVPASSVMPRDSSATSMATGKSISAVLLSCITHAVDARVRMASDCGSPTSAAGTTGPERAEGVEALAAAELPAAAVLLPPAGADVVGAGVATHEGERIARRHVAAVRGR
jgi:hypothetical protein